jgi:uncharacterized repeat protein (TIGR01451 family)
VVAVAALALGAASAVAVAGTALSGNAPGVAAVIPVGANPEDVVVDSTTHNIFVANASEDDRDVSVIDGSGDSGQVTATVPMDGEPYALAVDPSEHQVYALVNFVTYDPVLEVIDESGGVEKVTATIDLGPIFASSVAVDPVNHNVYIAGSGTLVVVDESGDANNGNITAKMNIASRFTVLGPVTVDPINQNVYVGDPTDGTVLVVDESGDAHNGSVTDVISAGAPNGIFEGLAVDPTTHVLYAANDATCGVYYCSGDETLSVVDESGDAHNGDVTETVDLGVGNRYFALGMSGVAIDPSTHTLYVGAQLGTVAVIDESGDADNGQVTSTVSVDTSVDSDVGERLTFDPSTQSLYATDDNDNSVAVITPPDDLAIAVSAPSVTADGSQLVERVTVTNNGPDPAAGVITNLLVPAGLTVASAPCAKDVSGTLFWSQSSLAVSSRITCTATFDVSSGTHTVIAVGGVVESLRYDPDLSNNVAIAVVRLG